jgi:hypothetical protein
LAVPNATPQEESATLRDLVQALIDGGVLNLGQGYSLVSRLDLIDRHLGDHDLEASAELFQAFVSQVNEFVSVEIFTVAQGAPLIAAAQNASDSL